MDFLIELVQRDVPFKFIPITWREEDQVSNANIIEVGWSCLRNILLWKMKIKKSNKIINYEFTEYKPYEGVSIE
jgi:hypothetical protein